MERNERARDESGAKELRGASSNSHDCGVRLKVIAHLLARVHADGGTDILVVWRDGHVRERAEHGDGAEHGEAVEHGRSGVSRVPTVSG